MTNSENQLWQRGSSDAPLPPFIRPGGSSNPERFLVEQYRALGPVFRLPRSDGKAMVVLAGPKANMFTARYGEEFFTTKERFSLGDHTCLGAGIAELQIMVITASLLHRYDLAMDPADYEMHIEYDPTRSPGKAFGMKVLGMRGV